MQIIENISLKHLNTFGIEAKARYFIQFNSSADIIRFINNKTFKHHDLLILNGGSNVLFTKDFDGLLMKIATDGFVVMEEKNESVKVKVEAGQNWDEFINACVDQGFYGLENLTMIPGNVGAAPMQNIGAYGVEQKDHFHSLEALNRRTGKLETFMKNDCEFGYRESIFKTRLKDQYIILSVTYQLLKHHEPKIEYGAIRDELERLGKSDKPTPKDVSLAVGNIRSSKLPNPEVLGNAGSFFKNPVIGALQFDDLKTKYHNLPSWKVDDDHYKIPAGWMIEHCGWRGKRFGDAGVCETQALVLVNHGKASGREIYDLAVQIQESVKESFGIYLQAEVNII